MNNDIYPGSQPLMPTTQQVTMPARKTNKWFKIGLIFIASTVILLGVGAWAGVSYYNLSTNYDQKLKEDTALAVKNNTDSMQKKFDDQEKLPNREFVGPDDYGRVTFSYPKTWSVYINDNFINSSAVYEAYLNPKVVPTISSKQQFATRVIILDTTYDKVLADYDSNIKKGKLTSTSFMLTSGETGVRLDGMLTDDIRGSEVILKIRDKTLIIRTDATIFKDDFESLIKTIKFNA